MSRDCCHATPVGDRISCASPMVRVGPAVFQEWQCNACPFENKRCGESPVQIALPPAAPTSGPGTELHAILSKLGFKIGGPGCGNGCQAWIDKMNRWGVAGCRENRQAIIDHLNKNKDAATLTEKIKAGAFALAAGLPLTVEGLVDEAIRRHS